MISDHNKQTNKPASKEKWNQAIKFPKCRLIRRWVDVICIVWPFFTRRFKNGKSIELALNSKRGINGQMNGIWRDIRFQWRRVIALLSYFDRNDEQRKRERERERSWKLNHDNNRNAKKCSMISTTSVSFFFLFSFFFFSFLNCFHIFVCVFCSVWVVYRFFLRLRNHPATLVFLGMVEDLDTGLAALGGASFSSR